MDKRAGESSVLSHSSIYQRIGTCNAHVHDWVLGPCSPGIANSSALFFSLFPVLNVLGIGRGDPVRLPRPLFPWSN